MALVMDEGDDECMGNSLGAGIKHANTLINRTHT